MKFDISCLQPKEQASFALRALYEAAGCRKYHMGRFEEYGLYQENRSFLSSEQVITFTDLDGRLLALKPDVTLSIAKTAQPAPGETLRYYYHENVYRPSAESHTFKEIGQMGLEMLGDVGEVQVRQAVSLAAQSLEQLGQPWVLEVSHMGYLFGLFNALGIPEGQEIEHKMLSKAIENAQKKIEGNNFGIRKNLLEYDQVMNDQREIIYAERMRVLNGENMRDVIFKMITDRVESCVDTCISSELPKEEWDLNELNQLLTDIIPLEPVNAADVDSVKNNKELKHLLKERAVKLYEAKETEFPEPEQFRELERVVLLKVIDRKWMDHIDDMDQLRQGIGLQAYGQRDPLVEYKMAGFDMFDDMIANIQEDTVRLLYHVKIEQKVEREQVAKVTGTNKDETATNTPKKRTAAKVYPNDPCPCGSGKKYKQCCGKMA